MNDLQIIGISGQAGSGKDYISQNILTPLGFYQWSLAWHFKVWLIGKGEATYNDVFRTKPPAVRKMLQLEGTENGRHLFGENVWVDTMYAWFEVLNNHWGIHKFVVPDVRFPNEVEAIKRLGGKVFRIYAPLRVANNSLSAEARTHASETALDDYHDFDGIIFNDPDQAGSVKLQVMIMLNGPIPQFQD